METKEIKLRSIEAFISQKTPTETIPSEVDKLLEYINKDNPEDVFKIYNVKLGADRKNELSEEENLRNIYFSFYDKMDEPERSKAKGNWNYDFAKSRNNPKYIYNAVNHGFEWNDKDGYWNDIYKKYFKINK